MIDFDLIESRPTTKVTVVDRVPTVTETVTTRLLPTTERTTHLAVTEDSWGWEELRDYVVSQIEKYHGPFPRNMKTEHSIFKSFASRWEGKAAPIARFAFEQCDGMWRNAPITVNRFCRASDVYFAQVIADRL